MDPNKYKNNALEIEKRIRKIYLFRLLRLLPIILIIIAFLVAFFTK
jgi:hypothetical protein